MLMSDVGVDGMAPGTPDLVFSDQATAPVPATVATGTWLPTDDDSDVLDVDAFPPPFPGAPQWSSLTSLNGTNPNGVWSLYVVDDADLDGGTIASWRLDADTRLGARVRHSAGRRQGREGQAAIEFTVRRSGPAPLYGGSVSWITEGCATGAARPATVGQDFSPGRGTLEFSAGETEKTFAVRPVADQIPEAPECFTVRLATGSGDVSLADPTVAQATLADDDPRAAKPGVTYRRIQRVLRQKAVVITAFSAALGSMRATGSIALSGSRARPPVRLRPTSRPVAVRQRVKLRLGLSKKALRKLRVAFTKRRRLTARVRVTATDLAGGSATTTTRVALRR
jgi:Calx-beta domain